MRWIDILTYDAEKDATRVAARCVLDGGAVRCEGEPAILADLAAGIPLPGEGSVTPADGEKFLEAVGREYRGTYLFASVIQEGTPEPLA